MLLFYHQLETSFVLTCVQNFEYSHNMFLWEDHYGKNWHCRAALIYRASTHGKDVFAVRP